MQGRLAAMVQIEVPVPIGPLSLGRQGRKGALLVNMEDDLTSGLRVGFNRINKISEQPVSSALEIWPVRDDGESGYHVELEMNR